MQPATPEAYQLLHQGGLALAAAEARGVRIDTARLAAYQVEVEGKKRDTMAWMREQPEFQAQRKRYGTNTNANSREQLAGVLYGDMGHPYPGSRGAAGQYLLDEARLAAIGSPYTKAFLTWAKLDKLAGTYLAAVARECTPAGRLHCFFNLHNIITYRSSSDSINFQNIPIRNKAISRYIRSCFVPDPGYCLLEADYSSAEVRVAACYHKDTTMLAYIEDDYDMHHAMGLECYKLAPAQMDKAIRNQVKGTFVFAEFYGDYYKPVAAGLWDAADKLRLAGGTPLRDHLASVGLGNLQAFTAHIKAVEHNFWKVRFPQYDAWRDKWWADYQQWGYFHTLTGFRVHGCFTRNEVINNPVQGSAFHCLLASLTEVHRRCLANKLRSRIVGQIHDSMLCQVHLSEVAMFTTMLREVMVDWLRARWPWLITKMEIDIEASAENWHAKKPLAIGVPL